MSLPNRAFTAFKSPFTSRDQLRAFLHYELGLHFPLTRVCACHDSPFEYIARAYFEPASDQIVWAPRGGGKTRLAAVATLLDLLHKPGIAIRIIGGSLEQSLRMWEHLIPDLHRYDEIDTTSAGSGRRVTLANASNASAIPQSQRAVRGMRVQKIRCDEVELFDPEIWEAAQLATRSTARIAGTIEALSTFHRPGGLMSRIIDRADATQVRVVRWCLLDVLERCPESRQCASCPLFDDCQGIAKTKCDGHFKIDDAIKMKHRVSKQTWDSEMLCRRPSVDGCVFPSFDLQTHVREDLGSGVSPLTLAMDFGFHNPFVCLWIEDDGRVVHVIDEYVQPQRTMSEHVQHIEARQWSRAVRITCDPAGASRNDQTAESNVQLLKRSGYRVQTRRSTIVEGIELIRAALSPAAGSPTLFIHPRCKVLIRALQSYAYPCNAGGELPLKDGVHDHPIDALRYFFVNRNGRATEVRKY